jgi:outer membrane receptor protein involved in Fe transport
MRASAIAASLCAAGIAAAAHAQDALEEVVVTAGFRDRSVMAGAGSVSVIGAQTIEQRSAVHLESILNTTPNVSYSAGASRARFVQLRGIGDLEQFVDPKHYPAVGIAVDDINLGGTANAAMLFDAEQVEILRGPQGTRFGTSALAGLVNVRGRRPTREFEGYVSAGVADYATRTLGAAVGGGLSERTAARIAVSRHSSDGYIDNAYLGRNDTNGYDELSARAGLDFEPTDRASLSFTTLYFESDNGYDAFSLDNTRTTLSDRPGHDNQQSAGLAARGEWQVGDASTVEAVATWLDSDLEYGFDEDWTYVGICDGTLCGPADEFSNTDAHRRTRDETSLDVRWLGDRNAGAVPWRFVVGAYVQQRDEDLEREYYGTFESRYRTEREAVYAEVGADLTAALGLTLGLRHERFDDSYSDTFAFASASDDEFTSGELSFTFQASGTSLLYATLARGNKAGGVNTEASSSFPFMQPQFQAFLADRLRIERERLTNLEAGVKGAYLDGRLTLRAALFRMERDDAQLESWVWDGVNFLWIGFLDNVDGSNSGLEAELTFTLDPRWTLFGSLGLLDTNVEQITTFDLDLGDFVVRRDIDQAKASSWQLNVGAEWSPSERWTARLELEGRDESRYGYYHDGRLESFSLVNGRVSYSLGDTEIAVWGRNLTDEDYPVHGLYFGNDPRKGWINESYFQLGEPRLVGLSVRHSF